MNLRTITRSLGPIDIRSVWRDSLLSWMMFMPIVIALFLRLAVPPLRLAVLDTMQFDLAPYYPVILAMYIVLLTPMLFGMLIGFLLLDEKDSDTLTALLVSPLPLNAYALYRLGVPALLSVLITMLVYPVTNLAPLSLQALVLMSIAAAPSGPLLGMFVAAFANNKVQGFALLKGVGIVLIAPLIAYFVSGPWQLAFGVFPTFWVTKAYWLMQSGAGGAWPYLAMAIVYPVLLTALLMRRFAAGMHR